MRIFKGFIIGIIVPLASFFLLKYFIILLGEAALLPFELQGINERRLRTICLIAICANLIPLQKLRKRRNEEIIKGISISTMLLALIWVYYFKEYLFNAS